MTRLQKHMADCGLCSRRKAEEYIANGYVKVNGVTVTKLGTVIDETKDAVTYKGKELRPVTVMKYYMLNKPEGYICSADDQFDRPIVTDLLNDTDRRLYSVGRLDFDTSGLLLITNDGDLCYKLTHPKFETEKTYIAKLRGTPSDDDMARFRKGLNIEDYKTAPAKIKLVGKKGNNCTVRIKIWEGRNRQVRKMCEAIGREVLSLERVAIGDLELGKLKKGEHRELLSRELKYLKGLGTIKQR